MPRNTKGGSKHKGKKNYVQKERKPDAICKDTNPEELEAYGLVIKAGGNRRFSVCCQRVEKPDECTTIMCKIKGSFRKRIKPDDYVLVKHFGFSDQAQIIDVYSHNELEVLKMRGMWDFPEADVVTKHKETDLYVLPELSGDEDSDSEEEQKPAAEKVELESEESDMDIDNI